MSGVCTSFRGSNGRSGERIPGCAGRSGICIIVAGILVLQVYQGEGL